MSVWRNCETFEVGPWIRMCWCSLLWKIHFCHLSQVHKRYKKISIIMLKENSFHLSCNISCVWSWPLSYFTVYGFIHLMCIWEYHHKHISNRYHIRVVLRYTLYFIYQLSRWPSDMSFYVSENIITSTYQMLRYDLGKNIWNFFEFRIVLAPMCYRSDTSLHALTALQTKNVINT